MRLVWRQSDQTILSYQDLQAIIAKYVHEGVLGLEVLVEIIKSVLIHWRGVELHRDDLLLLYGPNLRSSVLCLGLDLIGNLIAIVLIIQTLGEPYGRVPMNALRL